MWDETEFLSPYGIRSLSKAHEKQPFVFDGKEVGYEPAEAVSKIKGACLRQKCAATTVSAESPHNANSGPFGITLLH